MRQFYVRHYANPGWTREYAVGAMSLIGQSTWLVGIVLFDAIIRLVVWRGVNPENRIACGVEVSEGEDDAMDSSP